MTSDLEMNPSIQGDEPLSVLNINVASKQQHGERRNQSGVSKVDLGVFHLRIKKYEHVFKHKCESLIRPSHTRAHTHTLHPYLLLVQQPAVRLQVAVNRGKVDLSLALRRLHCAGHALKHVHRRGT